MTTAAIAMDPNAGEWRVPARGPVGMIALIAAESAIFAIFVVAYLYYIGKSIAGPSPAEVLEVPIFSTICLLSSSLTIHFAIIALRKGNLGLFRVWWTLTLALGTEFLVGTGLEWRHLIYEKGLTIHTNLFGTTYYSLVGLHASHVTVGVVILAIVTLFAFAERVEAEHAERCEVFSLYWHFVDAVWVVVFSVVYVIGR